MEKTVVWNPGFTGDPPPFWQAGWQWAVAPDPLEDRSTDPIWIFGTEYHVSFEAVYGYDAPEPVATGGPSRFEDIRMWAHERNLVRGSEPRAQFLKLVEEVGELSRALARDDKAETIDAIGDIAVVLTIIAEQIDTNLPACVDAAWEQIKDRKGRMVNGLFVKE
jgi:NTP pyrophosphatase (non-canonical NTP hydrolase)